jgi:hypothetical protein
MFSVRKYSGVYLLDQKGDVIQKYETNVPSWLIKPYDEQGFLEAGIADWGSHRRGDGFDLFAGGFLNTPPSNDRLAITEDTRYVYDPDTQQIVALVMVHPIRENGERSLTGVFKATSKGVYYYDLSKYDLLSGVAASGTVKSKLTAGAGTNYETAMELIYPLKVNNQTRYVWFVPIYAHTTGTGLITLAGLGIVDAQSQDKVVVEYTGNGIGGEALIRKAKESFRNLYRSDSASSASISGEINGTVSIKYEPYVKDGNTRQWFTVSTSSGKYTYLARDDFLDDETILKIQKIETNQEIRFEADNNNIVKKIL